MEIPLVSDLTRDMSRAFGVLCEDSSDGDCGVAFRGTFIMDPKGVVRSVQVRVCVCASRSVSRLSDFCVRHDLPWTHAAKQSHHRSPVCLACITALPVHAGQGSHTRGNTASLNNLLPLTPLLAHDRAMPAADQRPACRSLRRRDAARHPGVPVRGEARRGVPRRLEARLRHHEGGPARQPGILRDRARPQVSVP